MSNKIVKDAIALTLITMVAGLALGAVHGITKEPIAQQEAKAKAEAYEKVFETASDFAVVEMTDELSASLRESLDTEGYKAQEIEEVMEAKDDGEVMKMYTVTKGELITSFVMLSVDDDEVDFIGFDGQIRNSDFEALIAESQQ